MTTINRFEDLEIWISARQICKEIFGLTQKINFQKDYALVDQIKRSSGSAMDNIAEGFEREGKKEFINFLRIAKGSLGETRSQLYRAFDFGHIDKEEFSKQFDNCQILSRQIRSFISYLKSTF
jgi:four helix bundle protein